MDFTRIQDHHVSSLTKVFDFTSKIAITCLCSSLIACEPLLFGGVAGFAGSSSGGFFCVSGPADLSGQCRSETPTPGALEAIGQETSAVALNVAVTAQSIQSGLTLNIAWSPYPGIAAGYFVYYGPTSDTATALASDLPLSTANFNVSAPTISYNPTVDLGLSRGDTVCFLILAYDAGHLPYAWSQEQCTVV
jgi:hypothetical protein